MSVTTEQPEHLRRSLSNRHLQLIAGYNFAARRSSGQVTLDETLPQFAAPSYNDNRVYVTLKIAL